MKPRAEEEGRTEWGRGGSGRRSHRSRRVRTVAPLLFLMALPTMIIMNATTTGVTAAAVASGARRFGGPWSTPSSASSKSRLVRQRRLPKKKKSSKETTRPTPSPSSPGPTPEPTEQPTENPTIRPTGGPTDSPTASPTGIPTTTPTLSPTEEPTHSPSTASPTLSPTHDPTLAPSASNDVEGSTPLPSTTEGSSVPETTAASPSDTPSIMPSTSPTSSPTLSPSSGDDGDDVLRHSPTEVSLALPLMSLTLILPGDAASKIASDGDILAEHVETFLTGRFDEELRHRHEIDFLRAEVRADEQSGSWPVPEDDRTNGGGRLRLVRSLRRRLQPLEPEPAETDENLSAVSATLSAEAYFDGTGSNLPSDETVRYFLHEWFAASEGGGTVTVGEGDDVPYFMRSLVDSDPSGPLARVVWYDFSLQPSDRADTPPAAQTDAPNRATDRRAPNALAVVLGVFVPLAVLSLLFVALVVRRRRQSAAMVAKGFGTGAHGQSVRNRLKGGADVMHSRRRLGGESPHAAVRPPTMGALNDEDERGSNSYCGLSVEESMAQSSCVLGGDVNTGGDESESVSVDLTEAESASPPVSPQLTEDADEDEKGMEADQEQRSMSRWVVGQPLPAAAPALTAPYPAPGRTMPGPLLPPMPTSPDDSMEEALALPPYDPRRLEMIIEKSNEVVTKFEGERNKQKRGG